ncbi:hypothetical protein AB6A40_010598 [Gnathostoma spinigerum]|uniref:Uncharacterized protein n=1 Tax=Gnathostoma spinigerum TaxID=75299 RepID=A0ABD6F046_9BILA
MFDFFLPPENVSRMENIYRRILSSLFRLLLSTFTSYILFEFLFSSVWMHGYVWSINQKIDFDFTRASAGDIIEHQMMACSFGQRVCIAFGITLTTLLLLL